MTFIISPQCKIKLIVVMYLQQPDTVEFVIPIKSNEICLAIWYELRKKVCCETQSDLCVSKMARTCRVCVYKYKFQVKFRVVIETTRVAMVTMPDHTIRRFLLGAETVVAPGKINEGPPGGTLLYSSQT